MKTNGPGVSRIPRNLLFFSALLTALLLSVWARAQQVTLTWDANTESDLAGYKVHYGTDSRAYTTTLDVGGGPRCLDSLMGGISSESVFGFL